jgi:predicted anti-sigma-YlaC factor YlaD
MTEATVPDATGSAPIDCETAMRRLWDYLDERLANISRAEVDAHLSACEACRSHVTFAASMRAALAASSATQSTEELSGLKARMRATIRDALAADGNQNERS